MKEKIGKFLNKKYIPFLLLFILLLLLHIFMDATTGDYTWFKKEISKINIYDYIIKRYNEWTSRLIIEFFLVNLTKVNIWLFKVINIFVMTFIGILLSKLFVNEENKKLNYLIISLILAYQLFDMSTAGWFATMINYMWPLMAMLVSFIPIKNYLDDKKEKWYLNIIYALNLVFACNQEQSCAIILGVYFLFLIYMIYKKKISYYNIFLFTLSIISLIFILTCPGNSVRSRLETINNYPKFSNYGIIQKISLGVSSTIDIYFNSVNFLLLIMCIIISIIIFKNNRKKISKFLSLVPIIILLIFSYLRYVSFYLFQLYGKVSTLFSKDDIIKNTDLFNYKMIFCLLFGLIFFLIILYNIYTIIKKEKLLEKRLFLPIIYLAGLASRLIIGFSPTVFASGSRTNIFFDFSIIIVIIILLRYILNNKILKNEKILFISILFISIINYLSILFKLMEVGI